MHTYKRLSALLCISLLMISVIGCGQVNPPAMLISGQNQWIGSLLLPSKKSVLPLKSEETSTEITEVLQETPELTPKPAAPTLEDTTAVTEEDYTISDILLPEPESAAEEILPEPEDHTLVRVLDYIPEIRQSLAYAATDNFTGQRIYDFTDAYLRYGTIKKLKNACRELATLDLGILIWDAFRPLETQKMLWDIYPEEAYISDPATGDTPHCKGNTVDITLVDFRTGEPTPVPTEYNNFTDLADRNYEDCAPEGALYAIILEEIMLECGFEPHPEKWWQFTDTDDYAVEQTFHPTLPNVWIANCEKVLYMLKAPYSETTVGKIYAGESMELLGWNDKYARVSYGGKKGYVMSSYIKPGEDTYLGNILQVVDPDATYSYDQMLEDIEKLRTLYPDMVAVESIGFSELGRDIPVLRIGSTDAEYHILFQGAMHGREHMTAWLLMALTDYWLYNDILSYGNICYHIIPMSNPDGVTISQEATLPDSLVSIYKSDIRKGYTNDRRSDYARFWKANGIGEDINRNFPDGWKNIYDREAPSSMNYPGAKPFSTAEAQALRDYTLQYDFDVTISYHATGSLIFYEYGKKKAVNKLCKSLARAVNKVTGYSLMGSSETDGAGYKDWAIQSLEIPSLTIEVGCQETPLAEREIYSLFARNYRVFPAIANWLQQ